MLLQDVMKKRAPKGPFLFLRRNHSSTLPPDINKNTDSLSWRAAGVFIAGVSSLLRNDVFGLRALLTVSDGEFYFLSIGEGFEAIALNSAEVYEDIRPILLRYEAIAFCLVKPLHGTRYC
jgi:hypothetical protein